MRTRHDMAEAPGPSRLSSSAAPPTFVVTAEQYDRIARLLENKDRSRVSA